MTKREQQPAPRQVVRIGALSSDPSACDSFHAFDPESGIVYPAIADSLVYIDCAGVVQPGLAVSWRRVDPVTMEFDLREGVRFHNGDELSADDVVATFKAHLDPANRSGQGQGILSVVADCERIGDYRVRLRTAFPDGMLLNRLHIASAVYPRSILDREGPGALHRHPVGTGAYVFERWRKGDEIVLTRNPDHWSGLVTIDELQFPIMDQKDWVDALESRQLDIAINLDPHDARRIMEMDSSELRLRRREAALSNWFLLSHHGPLADKRVRLALNYAVHRHLLCQISNHGWASPQASLLTPGQVGFNPELTPYPYDPDHAQQLLRDAGHGGGFTLRGLVSESCASVYRLVRVFLENIGVQLVADIVPRPEWLARVVTARIREGKPYDGDFAMANVDNFTLHGLFHHAIFLFSQGVFSLTRSPDYDARFLETAVQIDPDGMQRSLAALDRYALRRSADAVHEPHAGLLRDAAGLRHPDQRQRALQLRQPVADPRRSRRAARPARGARRPASTRRARAAAHDRRDRLPGQPLRSREGAPTTIRSTPACGATFSSTRSAGKCCRRRCCGRPSIR